MSFWAKRKGEDQGGEGSRASLPVIKTARDLDAINAAVQDGFIPIVRKVDPLPQIRSKYCLVRHTGTGLFEVMGDYRVEFHGMTDQEKVIDWSFYYPHCFKSPFAAYLVPKDLPSGTRVLLEDLIEDYIAASWNQGDVYRLASCEAVWDGKDIVIDYQPKRDRSDFVG